MPKNRLSVGMLGRFPSDSGEKLLRALASYFEPEGIRAEIEFAWPCECPAVLSKCDSAEMIITSPCSKDAPASVDGKVSLTLYTVLESEPYPVILQHFTGDDLLHISNLPVHLRLSKPSGQTTRQSRPARC